MSYASFSDYLNKEFPSKYLKAEDLQGKQVKVTISRIVPETVHSPERNQNSNRLIAYFNGKEKGVILSKGRTEDLIKLFGDNLQSAIGKEVTLKSAYDRGKQSIRFQVSEYSNEVEDIDVNEM